jgi:hypothetical protein
MSFMSVAPSAIATARDASATPRSTSGNFPARASVGPSDPVSPAWSATLCSSTAPACPTRPSPPPATFSPWSHLVSFMAKSAPAWEMKEMKWCGNRVISQNRGALRPLNHSHQRCPRSDGSADRPPSLPAMATAPNGCAPEPGSRPVGKHKSAAQSREETITPDQPIMLNPGG